MQSRGMNMNSNSLVMKQPNQQDNIGGQFNSSNSKENDRGDDEVEEDNNGNGNDDEDDDDDDVVFIKEVPALGSNNGNSLSTSSSRSLYQNYITNTKKRKVSITEQPMFKKTTTNKLRNNQLDRVVVGNNNDDLLSDEDDDDEDDEDDDDDDDEYEYDEAIDEEDENEDEDDNEGAIDDSFETDPDGYYIFQHNRYIHNRRYITKELLGGGTFSKVIKVYDTIDRDYKAIKIIKNIDRYRQAAKNEIKILNTLSNKQYTQKRSYPILELLDTFDIKNHICLVTETFPCSVYDFMSSNAIPKFPGSHVQHMGKQLVESIVYLHSLGIIHTDLKPENMLLEDIDNPLEYQLDLEQCRSISSRRLKASGNGKRKVLQNCNMKLIDFGSAIFENEFHPSIISTRHYRAPEVILGYKWSYPCDVWSIGCVLYELATGETLFPIHDNEKHLIMIQRLLHENIQWNPRLVLNNSISVPTANNGNSINTATNSSIINSRNINNNAKEVLHMFDPLDGYKFDWKLFNNKDGKPPGQRRTLYQTDATQVLSTCSRIDKMLTFKLKKFIPWLDLLNYDLSLGENWTYIQMNNNQMETSSGTMQKSSHTPSPLTPLSNKSNGSSCSSSSGSSGSSSRDHSQGEVLDFETFQFWYMFVDLLRKMFIIDSTKRWTARQLMDHPWFNCVVHDEGTLASMDHGVPTSSSTSSLSPGWNTNNNLSFPFSNNSSNTNNTISNHNNSMNSMKPSNYLNMLHHPQIQKQNIVLKKQSGNNSRHISNDTESTTNLTNRLNDLNTTF